MTNLQPQGLHFTVGGALLTLAVAATLTLAGCASEKKTTSTIDTPAGTVTTTSVTTGTGTDAATDTNVSVDAKREVEPNQPIDANNTAVEMYGDSTATTSDKSDNEKVHVNMPGVHINVDQGSGKEDINVPFVHIHKDSQGNTQIKAPFVRINTKDGDSQ